MRTRVRSCLSREYLAGGEGGGGSEVATRERERAPIQQACRHDNTIIDDAGGEVEPFF